MATLGTGKVCRSFDVIDVALGVFVDPIHLFVGISERRLEAETAVLETAGSVPLLLV